MLLKNNFFTIQFIFAIIHESYYLFWYYSWAPLYYLSYLLTLSTVFPVKSFQFQLNKLFPNEHCVYGAYINKYDGRRVVLLLLLFYFFKERQSHENELF